MSADRKQNHLRATNPSPGTGERRNVCRYAVVQGAAWIGWREGEEFRKTPAKIMDLSLRGAMLAVETFPPADRPLWFHPPGVPSQDEWIEVRMISRKKKLFRTRECRIKFLKVFPYEHFKAVVYGPDVLRTFEPAVWLPEDNADRDWW